MVEANLVDEVVGQLQSGKEADVFLVLCGDELRAAKVYKDAKGRSFKQKAQYTEGRKSRNSRTARAMASNSRYGREESEAAWQNTEVEALCMLAAAGVSVPQTYGYLDGVLILQLITDDAGHPAPKLNDVALSRDEARQHHATLLREVVRMLCAGIIHGDLSEFNILLAATGPVIIDLPQAVQATANNAFSIFERDVVRLATFFGRFAPELLATDYAREIWKIRESGKLTPDTALTGKLVHDKRKVDVKAVLDEIEDAREEAKTRAPGK